MVSSSRRLHDSRYGLILMHLRELRLSTHSRYLLSPALLSTRHIAPQSPVHSRLRRQVTLHSFSFPSVRFDSQSEPTRGGPVISNPSAPLCETRSTARGAFLLKIANLNEQRLLRSPRVCLSCERASSPVSQGLSHPGLNISRDWTFFLFFFF